MLQIKGISKVYRTGPLTQQALDHVSLSLRDSEFVAILGQSGSGKTTLLNIIGGLDRYDEGDLVINGVSTKRYTDRDWDAYRNHSVGFVFQSYNLIPHQTILSNVELALTISGVSRAERTRRAAEALQRVGLGEHLHKKPSQLSGGQMQRVAIARALVNDPDILLADEPTGALDSETSIQVMDLLQEVARDRLVVMVTHNPELAERYATRIVNLHDGVILSDSDPFEPDTDEGAHRSMGRASMSVLTALSLSFNNLRTKLTRTVLVAFAGSIGIIGIAMILSLSNGVDHYIASVEEETLQGYPLQITDTSFDLTSMYAANTGGTKDEEDLPAPTEGEVREWRTVSRILSRVTMNDLASLKAFLDGGESGVEPYVRAIEYDYNLTPQIFTLRGNTVRQVNPDRSFSALGFGAEGMSGMLSAFSSTDSFRPMPADEELYRSSYDVKAGRWPERWDECVVVLTQGGRIMDVTLYAMGLKDPEKLDEMVRAFAAGESSEVGEESETTYSYEQLLERSFRLLCPGDWYVYDADYGVWTDKSSDAAFMRTLVENAEELKIVGVVQPREDATTPILTVGIAYPAALIEHIMQRAAVRAQLDAPETDVLSGRAFDAPAERDEIDMRSLFSVDASALEDAFRFDTSALDLSALDLSGVDLSGVIDSNDLRLELPELDAEDLAGIFEGLDLSVSPEELQTLFTSLMEGYRNYIGADALDSLGSLPEAMGAYLGSAEARAVISDVLRRAAAEAGEGLISGEQLQSIVTDVMAGYDDYVAENSLPESEIPYVYAAQYLASDAALERFAAHADALREQTVGLLTSAGTLASLSDALSEGYRAYAQENGLPDPASLEGSFADYLDSPAGREALEQGVASAVDTDALRERAGEVLSGYTDAVSDQLEGVMRRVMTRAMRTVGDSLSRSMDSMLRDLPSALSVNEDALAAAFSMNFSADELRDLMTSLLSTERTSYDSNLKKLGYADAAKPTSITIYPADFEGKGEVKRILDGYNADARAAGEDERVIRYTDMVDALMSSVTDIINAISYVLIAFVAISLVVSSIMIGVITYISVLERRKEIGILRAIGASKRNISTVFNAETFIIGALAGIFGVVITFLLLIPTNQIIRSLTDQQNIRAILPPAAAVLLIGLSIALTLIGGIIPSRKAARSDPVAALRSE